MVNSIGTSNINPIQMFNALNAFKSTQIQPQDTAVQEVSDGLDINENNVLKNQNLDEIKQFAKAAGGDDISNEDIKYGVTYGRSVIADYSA